MTTIYVFPGQGSQKKGMGKGLFEAFPEETSRCNAVLGYAIEGLCLEDPHGQLSQTEYTQPALYVVNALRYLQLKKNREDPPAFLAGHSLGEYTALFAAGVFDLITGLRLVVERARVMSLISGGKMAATVGLPVEKVQATLREHDLNGIDISSLNSQEQIVLAGPEDQLRLCAAPLKAAGARAVIPLNVSGPFHSRYMKDAARPFQRFLENFRFRPPQIPVVANVTAAPYPDGAIQDLLGRQLTEPVRWLETVRFFLAQPAPRFIEAGPGTVLSNLIKRIRSRL